MCIYVAVKLFNMNLFYCVYCNNLKMKGKMGKERGRHAARAAAKRLDAHSTGWASIP